MLTELNVHRVVITAVLLAAKFFDDAYYNNAYYAKVGGVLVSEMNSLEVEFLFRINFSLRVVPEVFQKYHAELVSHASSMGLRIDPCSTDPSALGLIIQQIKVQTIQHNPHGNVHVATPEIPQIMLSFDSVDSAVQQNLTVAPPVAGYEQPIANHYNNGPTTSHHPSLNLPHITPSPPQWRPVNVCETGLGDSGGAMYHHFLSQNFPASKELQQQLMLSHALQVQDWPTLTQAEALRYGNIPPFPQLPVTTTPFSTACSPAYYAQLPESLNQSNLRYASSQQPQLSTTTHKNCADLSDVGLTWQQPPDVATYNGHLFYAPSPSSEFPINNSPQIRS